MGRAVFYISGSWEIALLADAPFEVGVFAPPVPAAGDQLYVQDHPDTGFGIFSGSDKREAAETFLNWIGTSEFAQLYSDTLPGFLAMHTEPVTVENPLANVFLTMRSEGETTPRLGIDRLSAGQPIFEIETITELQKMFNSDGDYGPTDVAEHLQAGLESWYPPQQG